MQNEKLAIIAIDSMLKQIRFNNLLLFVDTNPVLPKLPFAPPPLLFPVFFAFVNTLLPRRFKLFSLNLSLALLRQFVNISKLQRLVITLLEQVTDLFYKFFTIQISLSKINMASCTYPPKSEIAEITYVAILWRRRSFLHFFCNC